MSPAPTPASALAAGRHVLRERLGEGASGEVWSADDPHIGRRVAIKLLRVPDGLNAELRAEWEDRFLLEAQAAGRLSHPGIVSIHDVGTASDGRPYIVMELVEGQNLDAVRRAESPPTVEQIVAWTIEVAEALDVAHRAGIVHRDIKPANLLIGTDGRARISDFGIARVAESELTRDGIFLGSPAFAAPEQLRGAKVDGRADLFSLGAVLYLLATGARPFEGDDIAAIAYAVCHVEPTRPSSLNPEIGTAIDAVILRAMQKDPAARYQTGRQLGDALRAAVADPSPRRVAAVDAAGPTLRDHALRDTSVEDRAVSIASAVARSTVRTCRDAASEARRAGAALWGWLRRSEPVLRRNVAAVAARVLTAAPGVRERLSALAGRLSSERVPTSPWWLAAVVAIVAGIAMFAGHPSREHDADRRQGRVWERLREIAGGKTSRVNVVVEHGLEDGAIEVSGDGGVLLRDSLNAPKTEPFGLSFLSHRSGTERSTLRLAPGRHELRIAVTAKDGLELVRTMDVEVDPRTEYDLEVSVATWPRRRLSADWGRVEP